MTNSSLRLKAYAGKTDKGPYLDVNEDMFDVDFNQNLFMLVDAFGGSGQGDVCARNIIDNMGKIYSNIGGDPEATFPFFYGPQYLPEGNALINAALSTHQLLLKENTSKKMYERSGASGVFLAFSENIINVLSVGNCRAYHYSLGKISKIYQEDVYSLSSSLGGGKIAVPLNAFGFYDYLSYSFREIKVATGDHLIMLSDGVYSSLGQEEIRVILEQNALDLNRALEEWFTLVNERDNFDNQSGVVLSF